jgi:hypothetical protein
MHLFSGQMERGVVKDTMVIECLTLRQVFTGDTFPGCRQVFMLDELTQRSITLHNRTEDGTLGSLAKFLALQLTDAQRET